MLARSYSRNSGSTSLLRLTVSPAPAAPLADQPLVRGVHEAEQQAHRDVLQPARDDRLDEPIDFRRRRAARRPRRRASIRSRTVNQFSSAVSGAGRTTCSAYSCGRFCRPMSSMSRKPSVVTNATGSPARWSSALVATVEPWTMRTSAAPSPTHAAARRTASITARSKSGGVEGSFTTVSGLAVERDEVGERPADVDADVEPAFHEIPA